MSEPEIEQQWAKFVAPWREQAERLGFRLLERDLYGVSGDFMCIDFLLSADSTIFLDLCGSIVTRRIKGRFTGFSSVNFLTYHESSGEKKEISTLGLPEPQPRPFGFVPNIIYSLSPLLMKLAPEPHRPVSIDGPEELAEVLERHRAKLGAIGGALQAVAEAPLEARWLWVEEIEQRSEDDA